MRARRARLWHDSALVSSLPGSGTVTVQTAARASAQWGVAPADQGRGSAVGAGSASPSGLACRGCATAPPAPPAPCRQRGSSVRDTSSLGGAVTDRTDCHVGAAARGTCRCVGCAPIGLGGGGWPCSHCRAAQVQKQPASRATGSEHRRPPWAGGRAPARAPIVPRGAYCARCDARPRPRER